MNQAALAALRCAAFRKSSYSEPDKDCVEIGHIAVAFGVRDSKQTHSPVLTVGTERGLVFLNAVKTGRFDR